ncbi:uncharacterized protein EV154DRAFT_606377 [Mucor mucedo]|uniref:uncharacterized protein n=1 Tax=Mucor mucedo TaxID=29922 RepID=UPI0022203369|nr:uncharacterized protein EV154DRAFT_606377 [Mucor mucedo]KAI7879558.1 hypothetical protein EV154DRAFT_606377 [Mucor mucedo]
MRIPQRAIAYLNDMLYNSWSFPDVVDLIKEELLLNHEDSFSWKSLIKQYENTKETRTGTKKSLYNVNINTAKNMFNNYQGTQTICSTFDETHIASSGAPISTSSTLTTTAFDDQASTSDSLASTFDTGATKTAVGDKFASLFDEQDEDDSAMNNQERFRREIYKAVYLHFKGELDLFLVARLNKLAQGLVSRNLTEALDLLSYCLLNNNMSPNEKNALNWRVCPDKNRGPFYIQLLLQDFSCADQIDYLPANWEMNTFEQAKSHCTHFTTVIGLSEEVKNTMQNLIEATTEELPLRLKIAEKKLQLLEGRRHKSIEMQALDVIEYLVLIMRRKEQRNSSELAFYRVTAHIMDIILNNSSLKLVDGENCSQATKSEQKANQKAFCDDDAKSTGRKIDLVQHIKNIRTNASMLKKMLSLCGEDASLCVVGMEWLGLVGCVYSVEKLNDVYVMYDAGTLIVPDTLSTLSLIVNTLDMLYKIKQHHEKLATILEPAIERSKLSRQLNKLRSAAEMEEDDTTNPIFFTPTTKRQKSYTSHH